MKNRRQQLVDRFEELTKQEIINYNDSLLETHKAMEDFRIKLKDSVDQYARQIALLSSQIKKVEAENIDLNHHILALTKKVDSLGSDINRHEHEKKYQEKNSSDQIKDTQYVLKCHKDEIQEIRDRGESEILKLKLMVNQLNNDMAGNYRMSKEDNENLKRDILSRPSEAEAMKQEIDRNLSSNKVDVEGVNQNITGFRKEFDYEKKKIEHLFNLIERLEKRIAQ